MKVKPVGRDVYADEALALDYALGILIEPDLGHARQRMGADASFALLVARYRMRLGSPTVEDSALNEHSDAPSANSWDAIVAMIACHEDR